MYIPPVCQTYEYPQIQDSHMMKVVEKYKPELDETYTYRERSLAWKHKHFWLNVFLNTIVLPVVKIRYAVRVESRDILRKNKALLKKGFVTVSNHVIEWDFLALLWVFYPRKAYFPIWSRNMETPMAPLFKTIGAIPVPTSVRGGRKFISAMDSVLEEGGWLHVFAEGSMWYFYPAVRDFHKGAAVFACKHNVPLIPLAISYRAPRGIYKLFKKYPNLTVHIGEPIFALSKDNGKGEERSKKDIEIDLITRARQSVMKMMGIKNEEENKEIMKSLGFDNF